jgi:hypothetical protein
MIYTVQEVFPDHVIIWDGVSRKDKSDKPNTDKVFVGEPHNFKVGQKVHFVLRLVPCDGEHPEPPCGHPECWQLEPPPDPLPWSDPNSDPMGDMRRASESYYLRHDTIEPD